MARHSTVRLLLFAGSALLLGACGGGDDSTTPPSTTAIAKSSANSGDAQSGRVGQPLVSPIQVVVTENGSASAGATVTWSTTAAGGTMDPGTSATDANGIASSSWTLGTTSGTQNAQAAFAGASGSPVTFSATAAAGPADALAKNQTDNGDNQTAEVNAQFAAPLKAKATDQFGNAVQGVAVAWAATGATVSASSVATDGSGVSTVNVTAGGTAGPITITAAADGLVGSPLSFSGTAVVPAPAPTTAAVTVGNIFFASDQTLTSNPAVDTLAVGGTVTWTWAGTGTTAHSVQSTGTPSFTSSAVIAVAGSKYEFTFITAGTYLYTCSQHPGQMTGRVVVR